MKFLIVVLLLLSGCVPCLQKRSHYYNPKAGEKCVPDDCTECFDLTKIR